MSNTLNNLPLEKKIGQLFFIGIAGPDIDTPTRELLDAVSPGGICLFSRNIREAGQTRSLLDELRSSAAVLPFLSLDQEGGTVDRLRRIVTPIAAANRVSTDEQAARMGGIIGEIISLLGFNMNFAPVVDVVDDGRSGSSNGLFSRPFGKSKEETFEFAGAFLRALQACGPIGCLKHFPGLGAAAVDSHETLPTIAITRDELSSTDLFPYRQLFASGDVYAVMAAHAAFPGIDLQEMAQNGTLIPSSLSKKFITTLLRNELGFDGLVVTDDLEMGAVINDRGIGEACVMAIEAGADMAAICASGDAIREGYAALLDAVRSGRIDEGRIDASLTRISLLKSKLPEPAELEISRLDELSREIEEFNSLLGV